MRDVLVVLSVLAVAGVGVYMWSGPPPRVPVDVPNHDPGQPPEKTGPDEIVSPGVSKPTQPGTADGDSDSKSKPVVPPKKPQSEFALRLGLSEENAEKVRAWHGELVTTQSQFGDEFEDGGDGPTLAKEFNSVMSKRRAALVALVGVESANKALVDLPVYEFDLSGSWHRVDAEGRAILFTDANKEDVWRNFQRKRRQP